MLVTRIGGLILIEVPLRNVGPGLAKLINGSITQPQKRAISRKLNELVEQAP